MTFSSFQDAKGRFLLDSVVISQVKIASNHPVAALTGAAFDAEVGATVVQTTDPDRYQFDR
jgi:hypothetical protein